MLNFSLYLPSLVLLLALSGCATTSYHAPLSEQITELRLSSKAQEYRFETGFYVYPPYSPGIVLEKVIQDEKRTVLLFGVKKGSVAKFPADIFLTQDGRRLPLIDYTGLSKSIVGKHAFIPAPESKFSFVFQAIDIERPFNFESAEGTHLLRNVDARFNERFAQQYEAAKDRVSLAALVASFNPTAATRASHDLLDKAKQQLRVYELADYRDQYKTLKTIADYREFQNKYRYDDPDGLANKAGKRLVSMLLAERKWESSLEAWKLTRDKTAFVAMVRDARSDREKAMLEDVAVSLVNSPSVLLEATPLKIGQIERNDNNGDPGFLGSLIGKVAAFEMRKRIRGTGIVRLHPAAPFKLRHQKYKATVTYTLSLPTQQFGRGFLTGDGAETRTFTRTQSVNLDASNRYSSPVDVDFGWTMFAYADRGIQGGYTVKRLSGEPKITISVERLEKVN